MANAKAASSRKRRERTFNVGEFFEFISRAKDLSQALELKMEQKIQEALHPQEEKMAQKIEDAVSLQERRAQEVKDAMGIMWDKMTAMEKTLRAHTGEVSMLEERVGVVEERVGALESTAGLIGKRVRATERKLETAAERTKTGVAAGGQQELKQLENRVMKLEAAANQEKRGNIDTRQELMDLEDRLEKLEAAAEQKKRAFADTRQEVEELQNEEQKIKASHVNEKTGMAVRLEELTQLENRVEKLESSVQKALVTVFPRVDSLLAQLEERSPHLVQPSPTSDHGTSTPSLHPEAASPRKQSSPAFILPSFEHPAVGTQPPPRAKDHLVNASVQGKRITEPPDAPFHAAWQERAANGHRLLKAAREGDEHETLRLLDRGADVNFFGILGERPLHAACCEGHAGAAMALLARGADVDARDCNGRTALHCAAFGDGRAGCVAILLRASARVESADEGGFTPLHLAAMAANERAARALLAAGAVADARSRTGGKTPLELVPGDRRGDDVRCLLFLQR